MKYIIDFIKNNMIFLFPLIIIIISSTYIIKTNVESFYNSKLTKQHLIEMRQLRPDLFYSDART